MQNGYYQATGAMVTQFNRLDVTTNNLANINTASFKRQGTVIADFKRIFRDVQDKLPYENNTYDAARFMNTTVDRVPQIDQDYTDFSQGGLKLSSNPLDLALTKKDAFLLVQTANGDIRLTKNGQLQLNEDNELVTRQGYRVLSAEFNGDKNAASNYYIQINPDAKYIGIDKDGLISVNGVNASSLYIAKVNDIRDLEQDGDNTYKIFNLNQVSHSPRSNAVAQGYYEASNVNPVTEMVHLIEANRMVEMYQKVMTSHMNDLNEEAINKLASSK